MADPTPTYGQEIPTRTHTTCWRDATSTRARVIMHVAGTCASAKYATAKSDRPFGVSYEDDIASGEQLPFQNELGQYVWLTTASGESINAGDLVEVADAVGRVKGKTAGAGWVCGISDENVSGVSKFFRVQWNPEYLDS